MIDIIIEQGTGQLLTIFFLHPLLQNAKLFTLDLVYCISHAYIFISKSLLAEYRYLVLAQISSKDYSILLSVGCLQSVYGIHTFRIESIAHGKAAPVDELQIQGVSNPSFLRKVN